jgi:hypothetical protein
MTEGVRPTGEMIGPSGEAFRISQATRAGLERIVGGNINDQIALNRLLGQPQDWNAQKLSIAFGPERGTKLAALLENEGRQRDTYNKTIARSQTAPSLKAASEMEAPTLPNVGGGFWSDAKTLLAAGAKNILQNQAVQRREAVAHLLKQTDPAVLRTLIPELVNAQNTLNARSQVTRALVESPLIGSWAGVVGKNRDQSYEKK